MKYPNNSIFKIKPQINAFTLVELLVAIMVSSIVLTAVVTLSYAMSSAYDNSADTNEKEAYIRTATLRINDTIKYCRLICRVESKEILVWRNDDNNNNLINISELLYIEAGSGTSLRLLEFEPEIFIPDYTIRLSTTQYYSSLKQWIFKYYPESNRKYTNLINNCSNISIKAFPNPPETQNINISFDMEENGQTRKFQINTSLRCQKSNFIDSYGLLINDDDDLK